MVCLYPMVRVILIPVMLPYRISVKRCRIPNFLFLESVWEISYFRKPVVLRYTSSNMAIVAIINRYAWWARNVVSLPVRIMGYAVDNNTLGAEWEPLFINMNVGSNEGIRHKTNPWFSAQFHPEAASGPTDTEFLFDEFVKLL